MEGHSERYCNYDNYKTSHKFARDLMFGTVYMPLATIPAAVPFQLIPTERSAHPRLPTRHDPVV